jgi:hypothetical protein
MTKQTAQEQAQARLDEIQGLVDLFFLYKSNGDDAGIARVEKRLDEMLIERGLA